MDVTEVLAGSLSPDENLGKSLASFSIGKLPSDR